VTLREKIEQEIASQGPMPFSRYMEMCLYDPDFGYYSRNAEQFGKGGDFYTSSDVHAVFGRLLSRQFEEMWRELGKPEQVEVLELGPGRGLFAQDVLDWSAKKFPEFFAALHYSLMEQSPALRSRLQVTLARHFESGKVSLVGEVRDDAETLRSNVSTRAFEKPAAEPTSGPAAAERRKNAAQGVSPGSVTNDQAPEGRKTIPRSLPPATPLIVFANEFFDALPVEIVSTLGMLHLAEGLKEIWVPYETDLNPQPSERLEVSLVAERYAAEIANTIQKGFLIAIDYGYTRDEQIAGRHRGTLMTYRQHSASANPYQAPGEQDITAHVNFTALAAALGGLTVYPLATQSQFLLGIGEANQFADAFEDCRVPQERAKVALQLKHLITPAGMGEAFHVLVASKGADATNLSGLSFGRLRRD
jgi:SAM-dependent MidA family methyltransferase